jgi:hypothetical protein
LSRPAEQAAFGIDLVFADLEREQPSLADDGNGPVNSMLKPILIGSAA